MPFGTGAGCVALVGESRRFGNESANEFIPVLLIFQRSELGAVKKTDSYSWFDREITGVLKSVSEEEKEI